MLRFLKPLTAPFLDRMEGRVRRSLELFGVPRIEDATRHTQAQLDVLIRLHTLTEARVASAQTALISQQGELTALRSALDALAKRPSGQDKVALWLAPVEARLLDMRDRITQSRERLQGMERRFAAIEERTLTLLTRQVVQLADGFSAVRTPQGWIVVPQEEHASLVHLAQGSIYHEPGTVRVITSLLREGDTAIDAGAHIGLLTIPMARSVGPTGRIVAVEPVARSAEALRRALTLNLLPHVELRQVAVSDTPGSGRMFIGSNSMMTSLFPELGDVGGQPSMEVEQARLDQLVQPAAPVALVKLDVEGAELVALAGMQGILDSNSDLVVIAEFGPSHLTRTGIEVADWFAAFEHQGLTAIHHIDDASGECREGRPTNSPSTNVLFSRPGNARVASLPFR